MGHPHPVAVLLMYLWASIVSFGALGLAVVDDWWPLAAIGGGVLLASLLTFSRLGSRSQETL